MFQTRVVEKVKTHTLCSVILFFSENFAVYGIMWKNIVERGQATDDNMAHEHCALDNTGPQNTHSEYVKVIAFPLQQ